MGAVGTSTGISERRDGRRRQRTWAAVVACLATLMGPAWVALPPAAAADESESDLRVAVLALARAISAVGHTPELAEPLPFTQTSLAEVLELDEKLVANLDDALAGEDLAAALNELPGVGAVTTETVEGATRLTFGYRRAVDNHQLALVYNDGDLRFGRNPGAGALSVILESRDDDPFVLEVDPDQEDPLLKVALVGRPVLDLKVHIHNEEVAAFGARQGFTEIGITGGTYMIDQQRTITMRDPNGRDVLTLEDLRYSTLPDLFNITHIDGADEPVNVELDIALAEDLTGGTGAERAGTLSLPEALPGEVWPDSTNPVKDYGDALAAATGLSMAEGLTALAQYTGTALALQDAATVQFPNINGDTTDLFAPGDKLLDLLSTAAVAQIQCGAAPGNPPIGVSAPGEAVYCNAITADGIGTIDQATWTVNDAGTVKTDDADALAAAVGSNPSGTIKVTGSDGDPDLSVELEVGGRTLTARSMPRTVQDVVERIDELEGSKSSAGLTGTNFRLDIEVHIAPPDAATTNELGIGNPGTLGALVGLTGLESDAGAASSVTAIGASYDVGFGIETGKVLETNLGGRQVVLLPEGDSLLQITDLSATTPTDVQDLPARIGFLGVTVDLEELDLSRGDGSSSAVSLRLAGDLTGPIRIQDLMDESGTGALDPSRISLTSNVTAGIEFSAHEQAISNGEEPDYASGVGGGASGTARVTWPATGLPKVDFLDGYAKLRVFDPVPASFLSGTASVIEGDPGDDGQSGTGDSGETADRVEVELTGVSDLYALLGVPRPREAGDSPTEVARRLTGSGWTTTASPVDGVPDGSTATAVPVSLGCQNVTIVDAHTLTCAGLAPNGQAAPGNGQPVELIVLGDPFALRDGIVEGLTVALSEFDRLDSDNRDDLGRTAPDQYTSTLPLVDLTPAQLAVEHDALSAGLGNLAKAATEDEGGSIEGESPPVSSAQELASAVDELIQVAGSDVSYRPALDYTLNDSKLGVSLRAQTPEDGATLEAPLRFTVDGPGQVVSKANLDMVVHSTTTLAIEVARDTASPVVADGTQTRSRTWVSSGSNTFTGTLRAGVGDLTVSSGKVALDLNVETKYHDPDPDDAKGGELQTTRTAWGLDDDAHSSDTEIAALAHLTVEGGAGGDTLEYHASATDTSGGEGAEQPHPAAMKVEYLAEGLDGLAAALDSATDGAAPRNTGADGGVLSVPLIGTDLDAGAGVGDILRALTSNMRGSFGEITATTAIELESALKNEMAEAVSRTDGLGDIAANAVTASVDCSEGDCNPCPTETESGTSSINAAGVTAAEAQPQSAATPSPSPTSASPSANETLGSDAVTEGTSPIGGSNPSTDIVEPGTESSPSPGVSQTNENTEQTEENHLGEATTLRPQDVDATEPECTPHDGPTAWDTVTVSAELTGVEKTLQGDDRIQFQAGLPGLKLRSDEKIDTTTNWTLPIKLKLQRGVGPMIVIGKDDTLELEVTASLPDPNEGCALNDDDAETEHDPCLEAIVGYLPAVISAEGDFGTIRTTVDIRPEHKEGGYDLFELYDGALSTSHMFWSPAREKGLNLNFQTLTPTVGALDLSGRIRIPWQTDAYGGGTFGEVEYHAVKLDVGKVAASMAKPFEIIDPYIAPLRDVIDVLATPIPVVSDLSELGGGGELSLLTLLETLATATGQPNLTMAYNVLRLTSGVADLIGGLADLNEEEVYLSTLSKGLGAALTLEPTQLLLYEKCTQTTRATVVTESGTSQAPTTTRTNTQKVAACPGVDVLAKNQKRAGAFQTTNDQRLGNRTLQPDVGRRTTSVAGTVPGFSLPFLADPNQIIDMLAGVGEASYFRLDLGSLTAGVSYVQRFGPIMAGPVPIAPFIGGAINISGRMAMGFDSLPQTLAVRSLSTPGDADELVEKYQSFGDVITAGFYLDDLDATGEDVAEVSLVTTIEAGAGVSIGIVTAGLKAGLTLTIGLDVNDPNDDGRLRTAEIENSFGGRAHCVFDVSGELEAFIAIFVRIWVFAAPLEYSFDLLRLGPYTLFKYGCPDAVPTLVVQDGDTLALTSGSRSGQRLDGVPVAEADDFEVRQFDLRRDTDDDDEPDTERGAPAGGLTAYEISGFGRFQRVVVEKDDDGSGFSVTIYKSGVATSTQVQKIFDTEAMPKFVADGGAADDKLSFLLGETFDTEGDLISTEFNTTVASLSGGAGNDLLVTGGAADRVNGEAGADSIEVGRGDDLADGGSGDDVIGGGPGRDDLAGGSGNDRVEGGPGADRADGGAGNDGLVGGPGRDARAVLVVPEGQSGDTDNDGAPDVVQDQVRLGFDSGDILVGGDGTDTVDGGDGSDVVVGGPASRLTDTETDGDDETSIADLFTPTERIVKVISKDHAGDASIKKVEVSGILTAVVPGDSQLDGLCRSGIPETGAPSTDFVTGGAEPDVVIGGDGPDRLDGGGGPDDVCGRAGDDQMSGDGGAQDEGSNTDVMRGGTGDDSLDAGLGDDLLFGDDADLFRDGIRVADGTLGDNAGGKGDDYLAGGEGADVLSGGAGADLVRGGLGDDIASGEGRDTPESEGEAAPSTGQRLLACNAATRVVAGKVDLNGDLLAGSGGDEVTPDNGRFAGLAVIGGVLRAPGASGATYSGLLAGEVVVVNGLVDLDRDGDTGQDGDDTGVVPLASVLAPEPGNTDGDCILTEAGDDQLRGGTGSDFLGAGEGADLLLGGDGNDLAVADTGTDVLLGGPHHDVLVGGQGDDHLQGEGGEDRLRGNEGDDDLIGGSDAALAGDGQDVLLGARGQDVLIAENGSLVSAGVVDSLSGDGAPTWMGENAVPSAVKAGDSDLRFDDSAVTCADGSGTRWVTVLASDGKKGTAKASPGTPLAYDELYGGHDCDWVFGSEGDDLVRGGQHDDVVEAGPGKDIAYGDGGADVVVGGSSLDHAKGGEVTRDRSGEQMPDVADDIFGDGGPDGDEQGSDLLLGDNATVNRLGSAEGAFFLDAAAASATYAVQLADVAVEAAPVTTTEAGAPVTHGGDSISGGGSADQIFGQGGEDAVNGDAGHDYVEGNSGADTLNGGSGNDDMLGGSSAANGLPLGRDGLRLVDELVARPYDVSAAGVDDAGDEIDSGAGSDVVLGDNGRVTRPTSNSPGVRDIAMADKALGGSDELFGEAGSDRLYGQGGADVIRAGTDDDYVEGNDGSDEAAGDAGEDVVIGGTSVDPTSATDIASLGDSTDALPDSGDTLYGDDPDSLTVRDNDLILGDNGTVHPVEPDESVWSSPYAVQLAEVPVADEQDTGGDDHIVGGPNGGYDNGTMDLDRIFGQGGDDTIDAGADIDYVEGNAGADRITTDDGDDDALGGSSATNGRPLGLDGSRLIEGLSELIAPNAAGVADGDDAIDSGDGEDLVLGDNGRVTRPGGTLTNGLGEDEANQPIRDIAMADTEAGPTSGSDTVTGGAGNDLLYGQLDDGAGGELGLGDKLFGEEGVDILQGDLAVVEMIRPGDLGESATTLTLRREIISERIYEAGMLIPVTRVPDGTAETGGPDLAKGGAGDDVLRLGGGADLANGDSGADVVFGGAGDDAAWGGTDHDRLFGGYGADALDLKKRVGDPVEFDQITVGDGDVVKSYQVRGVRDSDGSASTSNGADTIYGGWGPDELQADVGGAGPTPQSDYLIDWVGAHNVYYVCGGAYGAGRVIRQSSPDMVDLLIALARASGARDAESSGSGGWFDLGMVYRGDYKDNNSPHSNHPGNFTCEGGDFADQTQPADVEPSKERGDKKR